MPNRVVKDTIWSCPFLAKLSAFTQDQLPRWLLMADDWGCFDANSHIIKGLCYPMRPDVTHERVEKIKKELNSAGQLFLWEEEGRVWGYFASWDASHGYYSNKTNSDDDGKQLRHRRRTPEPPKEDLEAYLVQFSTLWNKRSNPNPNHNPNPKHKNICATSCAESFQKFWSSYPKRKSKGQAEKAWIKLNPDERLVADILAAIEKAKTSESWTKDQGKFIPFPATWLNAKRWEDEDDEPPQKGGLNGKTSKYDHLVE